MGAGKSSDGAWVVGAVSGADTVAHRDESGSAEVGSESLHGEDVRLRVGLDLVTSDDVGGAGACCGDNGSKNLEFGGNLNFSLRLTFILYSEEVNFQNAGRELNISTVGELP